MQQAINLVNTLPKKPKVKFSTLKLALGVLAVLVVWLGLYAILSLYKSSLQDQLQTMRKENAKLSQHIQRGVNSKFQQKSNKLNNQIDEVQKQIDRHKKLAGVVKEKQGWENKGFAPFMQLLADTLPEKVWLQSIQIGQGGQAIKLEGQTLDPSLLPQFIKRINKERLLNDIHIGLHLMNITKTSEGQVKVYRFDVKSQGE